MRYLFTLLFVLAIGTSAHGQFADAPLNITPGAPVPKTVPKTVPKKITQLITAADKKLLAECRLFVARPDLRTPALRDSVLRALQERQNDWAPRASDGNDTTLKRERTVIEVTCNKALGPHPQPTPVAPPTASTVPTAPMVVAVDRPPTTGRADQINSRPPNFDHQTPQIEPWPPPRPTDQAEYSIDRTNFKTVGEFADALMARLNGAGMHHLRFWGAPNGVAVVVPLEAIDERARPIETNANTGGTQTGGPLSAIVEGFLQLVSEPIRDSRVLLFVLTNDSKARHQTAPMTPEIGRQWMQNDYMRPEVNRSVELTDQHFVLAAVYEFRKENNESDPALLTEDHKRHSLKEHLAGSQLDINGLLK